MVLHDLQAPPAATLKLLSGTALKDTVLLDRTSAVHMTVHLL